MKAIKIAFIVCICLGVACAALAEKTKRIAVVSEAQGTVEVKISGKEWIPAVIGATLSQGDMIRTKENSTAVLNLDGDAQTASVDIKEKSQMSLAQLLEDKTEDVQTTLLDLSLGSILIKAKKLQAGKSRFEVKTPTSIVGVRGTTFSVTVEAAE